VRGQRRSASVALSAAACNSVWFGTKRAGGGLDVRHDGGDGARGTGLPVLIVDWGGTGVVVVASVELAVVATISAD
jgi:hypothetical protein